MIWKPAVSAGGNGTVSQDIDDKINELVESIELIGNRMLGRKCVQDHIRDDDGEILVAMMDEYIEHTLWFEILKVGKKCKYLSNEQLANKRMFMYFPEWDDGMHSLGNDLFIVSEDMMQGANPSVKPFVVEEPK